MKILVDGYGSIGRQYAKHLCVRNDVAVHDPFIKLDEVGTGIKVVKEVNPNRYDLIVIASPSGTHVEKLREYHASGAFLLVEKPLAISMSEIRGYQELKRKDPSISQRAIVSSPRRFAQAIRMLKSRYSSIHESAEDGFFRFSHSLRRMRGVSWRDNYVATSRDPLSIVFDCIHELDIATSIFGKIRRIDIMSSYSYSLSKTPTVAMVRCEHDDGKQSHHHFDFCSDVKIRSMTVRGKNGTYSAEEIGKPAAEMQVDVTHDINDGQYAKMSQQRIRLETDNPLFAQIDKIIESNLRVFEEDFCTLDNALQICKAIINANVILIE